MEIMLSGSPLYGAGDLVNRLPPQAPAGKGAQGHGCCWRRAPLNPPQAGAWALELADGRAGPVGTDRPLGRNSGAAGPTLEAGGEPCHGGGPMAEAEAGPCHGSGPCHGGGPTVEAGGGPCHGSGPTAEAEAGSCHGSGPCHGGGPTAEAGGGPYHGGGPAAEAEGGLYPRGDPTADRAPCHGASHRPCHGAGLTAETEGGPCHGAGPTEEAEGGPCHGAGPTAEAEGGPCHGAGPTAEAEDGPCHGGGPTAEAEVAPCLGNGPTMEAVGGHCHRDDPSVEAGGGPCHGTGPTAEAEVAPCHGAGLTAEAEGGPYHGGGPTAEAEGEHRHRGDHTAEAEGGPCHRAPCHGTSHRPCHGVGPAAEADGGPYHGAGHRHAGSSQDQEICACKDGAFKELAEPHKQQWRYQSIQAGKGSATTVTGLSETHPGSAVGLLPAGPVTMATAALGGQAKAGEKVGASDCEEPKEAGEHDDDFGTFEKAGNPVQWAEFAGPLWPEGEDLCGSSGTTAGRSQEAGEDVAARRAWRRRSENAAAAPETGGTVQRHASLHGTSSRAAGSRESGRPLISTTPSHVLTADGGWRPFHGGDSQSQGSSFDAFSLNRQETAQRGVGGKWWSTGALEHHTFQTTSPSESSPGNGGLESMFRSCFPGVSSASSGHAIPPLGQLLGRSEEKGGKGFLSAQACGLWASLQDVNEAVGLKYKWAECRSRRRLLASLHVDPASADPSAGHTRTLGSSPLSSRETKMRSHPSLVTSDLDPKELMLIKNSVPQHQTNGFSPTHRIQALFYHWTQADRNGKSKTPYDVNKNFLA